MPLKDYILKTREVSGFLVFVVLKTTSVPSNASYKVAYRVDQFRKPDIISTK